MLFEAILDVRDQLERAQSAFEQVVGPEDGVILLQNSVYR
jgi:hypothetical protein